MAVPPPVLIAGGSGVFGRRLARELLETTAVRIVLAGRDRRRAEAACRQLDPDRCDPRSFDLRDAAALEANARGCFAVACTAGPFQAFDPALPAAAVRAGAHWLDIGDSSGWVLPLLGDLSLSEQAAAARVTVAPGLSTVPCLAGILARELIARVPGAARARVTLFIGNRNAKGAASVATGLVSAARAPMRVETPVGPRPAWAFDSPLVPVLREELGLQCEFRVAFEFAGGFRLARAARPLALLLGRERLARAFALASRPLAGLGSDLGRISVDLEDEGGRGASASLTGRGQRMPVLPLAIALSALLGGDALRRGVVRGWQWAPPGGWLAALAARGLEVTPRE